MPGRCTPRHAEAKVGKAPKSAKPPAPHAVDAVLLGALIELRSGNASARARKAEKAGAAPKLPKDPVGRAALAIFGILRARFPDLDSATLRKAVVAFVYVGFCAGRPGARNKMTAEHLVPVCDIDTKSREAIGVALDSIPEADRTPWHLGRANEVLCAGANSSEYTPLALAHDVTVKTIDPLLRTLGADGHRVTVDQILQLRLCDPAVGAGVFQLCTIDYLADKLIEAGYRGPVDLARRMVAIHCVYGTDIDPVSVLACKCALSLHCLAGSMPPSWMDDNIKHGDALVGLLEPQLRAFHWQPEKVKGDLFSPALGACIDQAMRDGAQWRKRRMMELGLAAERS